VKGAAAKPVTMQHVSGGEGLPANRLHGLEKWLAKFPDRTGMGNLEEGNARVVRFNHV